MEPLLYNLGDSLLLVICGLLWLIKCCIAQVLYATPTQDGFYDITDALEEQGMEQIIKVKYQVSWLMSCICISLSSICSVENM